MPARVEAGDAAEQQGVEVVEPPGHADGVGRGLGDDQTIDVPDEDDEEAEVEERASRSAAAWIRRAARSGWSSRTCRSGTARTVPPTSTAIMT